ncbi:MAG: MBL fold metallo-hydrolase, partial [Candidatus Tectomicrobia bacterium]|nr:MBL fold metallo-hydrolase [Candidatus Tectomicrobia bacterium]
PGHTPGHIALFMEAEKILFPGDNVVGTGTTAIPPAPQGDMFDYVNSLRKLLALESRLICSGHGPIIENTREKIEFLLNHRQGRENQIIDALRGGKETSYDIMLSIYEKEIEPRLYRAAEGQVISHLIKLEKEGRVKASEREGKKYYSVI